MNTCESCDRPVEKDGDTCGRCKFEEQAFGGIFDRE
jgi:RNA polymerase subunit RPABC4/transcription elongation factor Spt4